MLRTTRRNLVLSSAAVAATAAGASRANQATPEATPVRAGLQARLLDSVILPNDLMVDDTLFGGISGIDYDTAADTWYLISDDRSDVNPARFYTASIAYDDNGFTDVTIDTAVTLLDENGEPFPSVEEGGLVVDPEALRVDPHDDKIWWTSEGVADLELDPFVAVSNPDGTLDSIITLPAPFVYDVPEESGPRDNHTFEGLSFSPDGETLWVGMEYPLYQDGPIPSSDSNAWVRLVNIDRAGTILREFAVELDQIDAPEDSQYIQRGMSEILVLDENRLLSIARTTIADAD